MRPRAIFLGSLLALFCTQTVLGQVEFRSCREDKKQGGKFSLVRPPDKKGATRQLSSSTFLNSARLDFRSATNPSDNGPCAFAFETTFTPRDWFVPNRSILTKSSGDQGQQNTAGQTPAAADDAHELAKKLTNPVASLISVPFQSNFDFGMGTGSGWRYTMNFQPVIPVALNSKWNMVSRTILPIIHQHNVANIGTQSGLGDITQSFFFTPADSKSLVLAAGPVLLIPTATNDLLGSEKFGLGPTFLVLKQQGPWTYGVLTNHIWSVAGDDQRASVNNTFLQPFLAYNTKDAWTYNVNTESSYDWTGNHWNVPIHVTVSKLVRFGKHPVSFGGALRCWATSSPGGPEGCGFRFVVTPLFPR